MSVLNQELNRSFSSLSEMIEKQHLFLSSLISHTESGASAATPSSSMATHASLPLKASEPSSPEDSHQMVMELHQQGVKPEDIAAQLKIPRGEVELMVKMASAADSAPNPSKSA